MLALGGFERAIQIVHFSFFTHGLKKSYQRKLFHNHEIKSKTN
jgi:hypothetical protein